MGRIVFLIAIGGAMGSVFRYLASVYFEKLFSSYLPYGTLIVNIAGCLLIGIFYGLSERFIIGNETRMFLTTGLCGGFTTFSAFAYENIKLLQNGQLLAFAFYSISSFVFGLIAVIIGLLITKNFL